jgi:hypothetical protein
MRALFKRILSEIELLDLNDVVEEVVAVVHGDLEKNEYRSEST